MRQEYRRIVFKKISELQISYLGHQLIKLPLIWLGVKRKKPLTGPIQAIINVTYRCNLSCQMCDLWRRPNTETRKEFTTSNFFSVIDDLVALKTTGVGFTGGEPLLRKDIFQLINYVHLKGMTTHLATNGLLLDKININRLLDSGLDAISVSLDGPTAAVHDQIRNQKGCFVKVLHNLKLLDQERKKRRQSISVVVNCAISNLNADKILDLVKKINQFGVDGIGFIPVQESGLKERKINFRNKLKLKNKKQVNQVIEKLIEIKKQNPELIDNTIGYLKILKDFFAGKALPIPCLVGYHSCVVDVYGEVYPCIPFANLNKPIANLKNRSFKEIWTGSEYQKSREKITTCRRCFWNCHSEVNLFFNKPKT